MPIRLLVLFTLLLAVGCRQEAPPAEEHPEDEVHSHSDDHNHGHVHSRLNAPAPDFTLYTPEGEPFSLADQMGNIVVINFWATWCLPCVVEIPEIEELHQEYGDRGVVFIGISQDTGEDAAIDVRDFREMFGVSYPLVLDPGLEVGHLYDGITALPTTVVIDQEGRVHRRRAGLLRKSDILNMFRDLLG